MKKMNSEKDNEILLSGTIGSPGIVIGKTSIYQRQRPVISEIPVNDDEVQKHLDEFQKARRQAIRELEQMLDLQEGKNATELVDTQLAMIKDPELNQRIEQKIVEENKPADAAVESVFEGYLSVIEQNHEQGARERSVDITDVRDRLIQILHKFDGGEMVEDTILIARELSAREVIECSERNIKGIIMDSGGVNSHAAIIARSIDMPTILATQNGTSKISDDDLVILDGLSGQVILNPGDELRQKYQKLSSQRMEKLRRYKAICKKPNKTKDGVDFCLRANIEFKKELDTVKKYCGEGIGLLRTESLYLHHQQFLNAKKQEAFYTSVLEKSAPYPVTIRLFDTGGDKFLDREESEANPNLGWRGIRMLLDDKKLLNQQLKAICRTACQYGGRVKILIPMVSTLEQLLEVRERLQAVQDNLRSKGLSIDEEIPLGIMIEVPNVAMQADQFAEHADFLSIGTNDLTQYLLAVDRGNEQVSDLYTQRHPMIWRLIQKIARAAQNANKPLSVCGELASDPPAACCLMGMGISELSMNPAALPTVKKVLRAHSLAEMEQLKTEITESESIEEINEIFENWKESKVTN